MMRSLYSGVQGLRAHQVRMDVIGNNIANVNTTAFKSSRVNFADMVSQTMSGAQKPTATQGGINPKQVGLGVGVSSIDIVNTQGSFQLTGKVTDMAISGNGFFVLKEGQKYVYTRAGNFDFDANGYLVNPATGQRVQGWMPTGGVFPTRDASTITDLALNMTDAALATPTKLVTFDQQLNAATPITVPPTSHTASYTVIDSLGAKHSLKLTFTKVANNAWDIRAVDDKGVQINLANPYGALTTGPAPAANDSRIQFNPDGSLQDYDANPNTPWQLNIAGWNPGAGAAPMTFAINFDKTTQPSIPGADPNTSTLRMLDSDGFTSGTLANINVDNSGNITGYYSNGDIRVVGQVALANFANPGGLNKEPGNNWSESTNSGLALIGAAGEAGRGSITPSNLEMSNVDISAEFTNMIVTQRGFQANSKIITTTDELLQDVVNLKR